MALAPKLREKVFEFFGHVPKRPHPPYEVVSPKPLAPPIGYVKQPSLMDQVRDMVRSEQLAAYARQRGSETFEESEDFDVGDDYDPRSPYEAEFDPPIRELLDAGEKEIARKATMAEEKPVDRKSRSSGSDPEKPPQPREDAAAAPSVAKSDDKS